MGFSETIKEMLIFGIHDNRIDVGMVKDVRYIFGLQTIVDSFSNVRSAGLELKLASKLKLLSHQH